LIRLEGAAYNTAWSQATGKFPQAICAQDAVLAPV
jgi:hypothetical protein